MKSIAKFIYRRFWRDDISISAKNIRKMLVSLYPGMRQEELYEDYLEKKILMVLYAVICALILIIAVIAQNIMEKTIDDQGRLMRKETVGNMYETQLVATVEDENIDIVVEVADKKLTKQEVAQAYEVIDKELEQIILGDNQTLTYVTEPLNLVSSVDGYPFKISWESSDYNNLQNNGKLGENIPEEGIEISLSRIIRYEDYEKEKKIDVVVFPEIKSNLEIVKEEIIASIQEKQLETENKEYLQLPLSVGGKEISWKKASSTTGAIMAILSVVAIMGIWWGVDNDLAKRYEKRDQLLRTEYSEFVSKLQLLISSGMTLRGAMERMEADYKLSLNSGEKTKYVYEELCICLKRLRDGASETDVYLLFGNRCGQMSYKKLMTLLTQNLKKGTVGLLDALEYECKSAFEERKHIARRAGEEAQTKLLFPMIMMLGIVMIIILVPAYFSFTA